MTDHDGKLRVAQTSDGVNTTLLHRATEEEEFKPVITNNFKESLSPQFFTFDNKHLYALSNLGRDKSALVKFDLTTGKELEKIYENPEYDLQGAVYSRKRKVLTHAYYQSDKYVDVFFDKYRQDIHDKLKKKLGNYHYYVSSTDRDEELFIVNASSDRKAGLVYFYEVKADKLTLLSDIYPWLKESDMVEMKPISFKSRDGITLHGYLTLPQGKSQKNLPVIVNPHGGPWFRDSWGFNPEVQFLANRGYAVLQINFRGSTGYGREFWEASFKEWGKKMQDDISDGVDWLVKNEIADKKRIGIYGGSYGGYATLAGLAFTPDLYACGVDYVGVSNLFTLLNTIPPYWKPFLDMFHEMVGDPQKDSLLLREASPVFHVDKIKAPLFVAQGANDPRVKKAESDQIVEALKKRGIDVPYLVKDNEGHGFHNEENRMEFYTAMEKFLAKHLKPNESGEASLKKVKN